MHIEKEVYFSQNTIMRPNNSARQTNSARATAATPQDQNEDNNCCCIALSYILIVLLFPFSLLAIFKRINTFERAAVLRLGKVSKKARGPGVVHFLPCVDRLVIIDMRERYETIMIPSAITKDSVTLYISAVVFYRVINVQSVAMSVQGYVEYVRLMGQSALRNAIGTKTLSELMANRDEFVAVVAEVTETAVTPYGVHVERVEILDMRLPADMQGSFATEAAAQREARAKVILSQAEQQAAHSLKQASDILNLSPSTVQLRYFQTMRENAKNGNQETIVFPIPIDMRAFLIAPKFTA